MNELMTVQEATEYISYANDILYELKASKNEDGEVLLKFNDVDHADQCLSKFLQIIQNAKVLFN